MSDTDHSARMPALSATPALVSNPPLSFPVAYIWVIILATFDVLLTAVVLGYGRMEPDFERELNPIARIVIRDWGMPGGMMFKYALVMFVIIMCETIARHRERTARALAWFSVAVTAFPVLWSLTLLYRARDWFFDL